MQLPPIPADEELRLNDLLSYEILDTIEEKEFDDLAELAADICGCPSALITFIDKDRQWYKARKNVGPTEIARDLSFCGHTLLFDGVMVIPDAKLDERFFDNPAVATGLRVNFYAGAPIISAAGNKIGTVCVFDQDPRNNFTDRQKKMLSIIADHVTKLLELRIANKNIINKSNDLIAIERKMAQLNIEAREEENTTIAYQLHENFIQTLGAVKLYIDFASQSKDLADHFLELSKEQIHLLIDEMKALTKTITPTTLQSANYLHVIEDMVYRFSEENNIKISFKTDDGAAAIDSGIGLTLYRIVELHLKNAQHAGAKKITISIKTGKQLKITIKDDGVYKDSAEKKMYFSNIYTRADLLKAKTKKTKTKWGHNVLHIDIPVAVMKK
ncbi:GAF domain-containing sensor histidine kinase [Ferruginibacter albus]|uniref:GAF domain-containing sensor histidine kinase n=1 Tax=Ferruginibacter albus TaxID=2875540 RepID=UPI001CC466B5|nr:GAF domain-containing sensor histidine kinase [Ferruginibacter albus]UAY52661.1 GAF domain-containing protein [Ferruginibacter albus]